MRSGAYGTGSWTVAVGIRIAPYPPHRSVRAGFPHTALASGGDAHAAQRIGMIDAGRRQPAVDEPFHPLPRDTSSLASTCEHVMPKLAHGKAKVSESIPIAWYSVVSDVPAHNSLQPLAHVRNRFMHASPQFGLHRLQLGLHAFADRLPKHGVPSFAGPPTNMGKTKKGEGFRLPEASMLSVFGRKGAELQEPGLFRVQFQVELLHAFFQFRPEPLGIRPVLESNHDVVREAHHDHITMRPLPSPCLDPQIEYVMKINVRQKRRCTATLRRPFLHAYSFSLFQHAGVQPFLDEPHDAPVRNTVLDELHQPFVGDPIEKAFDVQVEHPVHFFRQQSRVQRIQRLMLASPWSEPVRKAEKIRFVDSVQHLDRRALDDLVFQRRYSERPLPPVGLRYIHPTHRFRSVRSSLQPFGIILQIYLHFLAVVPPRIPV